MSAGLLSSNEDQDDFHVFQIVKMVPNRVKLLIYKPVNPETSKSWLVINRFTSSLSVQFSNQHVKDF